MNLVEMARELLKVHAEWNCLGILRNSDEVITLARTVVNGGEYRVAQANTAIYLALADSRTCVVRHNAEFLADQEQAARDLVTTIIVVRFGETTDMYAMGKLLENLYKMNAKSWDFSSWDSVTLAGIVFQHRY